MWSALSLILLSEASLYGLLAYFAIMAAKIEKQAGRDQLCRYHRLTAAAYALLCTIRLLTH